MKPPPFRYHAPGSVEEALAVLAEVGADGKVLAGGQSLVPILNMRLAAPKHLVDINRVSELDYLSADPAGVRVGALARHARVERDKPAFRVLPLLHETLRLVAHPVIRNRGTVVGSLVHADPAGELTAVLALLGGSVVLRRYGGTERTVAAADFFRGPLESDLRPGELAVEAVFPVPAGRTGLAVRELARRHGDYAMCGLAIAVGLNGGEEISQVRAAYFAVGDTPVVLDLTEALAGSPVDRADWPAAGRFAKERVRTEDDLHATADYRGHLVEVLTARAVRTAARRAKGAQAA
ncbi:MAG TPA: FAD binding domain-containing protein [Actinomycetes bacterium]|nr:FAD binding domain-containing protein [Actinomycetes bacterium]